MRSLETYPSVSKERRESNKMPTPTALSFQDILLDQGRDSILFSCVVPGADLTFTSDS